MQRTQEGIGQKLVGWLSNLTLEQKAAVGLAGLTAVQALRIAPEVAKARQKEAQDPSHKEQRLPSTGRVQDHPLASWVLGNSTVLAMQLLRYKLIGNLEKSDSKMKLFLKLVASSMVTVDGTMLVSYFYINYLYKHTPFFSEKRKKQTYWEIFTDYISCNAVVNLLGAAVQVMVFRSLRGGNDAAKEKALNGPFRPLRFLARLALMRFIFDAAFWMGHYILHSKKAYWAHRRHHEHSYTQHTTNYHFAWYDLVIEGFMPFFIGMTALEGITGPVAESEVNLLAGISFSHEIASHAGKALPYMNCIPPLAPWFQMSDDKNCFAHEIHHRCLKQNLSISYYFDTLVGTSRWDISKQKSDQPKEEDMYTS